MSEQRSLPPILNAISSLESEDGRSLSGLPDGATTGRCGQEAAHVNRSAASENNADSTTTDTCGPHGSGSLKSNGLALSLGSRLMQQLGGGGSTLFKLTWKESATPSGLRICRLRASALRIDANDYGSWPTPTSPVITNGHQAGNNRYVTAVKRLAGWVTPSARDWKDSPGMATIRADGRSRLDQLPRQAQLAGSGEMRGASPAQTAGSGPLNPAHSRWLMGFPPEWDACAPMVTQSSRR